MDEMDAYTQDFIYGGTMIHQLNDITKQKNKAFKIFTVTKEKFLRAIEQAYDYKHKNNEEIDNLHGEISDRVMVNIELDNEIKVMNNSVEQINKILGA